MTSIDIAIIIVGLAICAVEYSRGFCRSTTDFLFAYGALYAATTLTPIALKALLAHNITNLHGPDVFAILCLLGAVLTFFVGRFVSEEIHFELGLLDKPFAAVASVGLALVVGHAIVQQTWMTSAQAGDSDVAFASDQLAQQLYSFDDYHSFVSNFTGNSTYARSIPGG